MNWNGLALQNEFATEQSDTSTAGKSRVLQWINDIQQDICARVKWDFLLKEGRKTLTASSKIQTLNLATPSAPTIAVAVGGSLTASTNYYFCVTFYESVSKLESLAGTSSAVAATTAANKTVNLSAIPTSSDPLVTSRKIYIKSGSTDTFYYHSTIEDNTTTTASITSDTTSTIQPPDYSQIGKVIGNPNIVDNYQLEYRSQAQIRRLNTSLTNTGTPDVWCSLGPDSVLVYPMPSSALQLEFFYRRNPAPLYASADSIPELPIFLKEALSAGVRMKGYFYSDRDGKIEQKNVYEALLSDVVSRNSLGASGVHRVTDVYGSSDGYEV